MNSGNILDVITILINYHSIILVTLASIDPTIGGFIEGDEERVNEVNPQSL